MLCFRHALEDDPFVLDYIWRIIIAVGIIPALASLYFRLTIPETPRYMRELQLAASRRGAAPTTTGVRSSGGLSTFREFARYFAVPARLKVLVCACIAAFCADLAFYGANLNSSIIMRTIGLADRGSPYEEIQRNALGQLAVAALGTVPGYLLAALLVDRLGRRTLQMIGFGALIVIYAGLGVAYWYILFYSIEAFVAIFAVAQLFLTLGPVTTAFIIPAEAFPTRFRATACGIVAAVGKLGAALAQFGFAELKDIGGPNIFFDRLLYVFAGVMLLGLLATIGIPETKGLSLEQLEEQMDGAGRPGGAVAAKAASPDATVHGHHGHDHHHHGHDHKHGHSHGHRHA
jgi:PHS family inorganic phosphate transporter-like MFS transporter